MKWREKLEKIRCYQKKKNVAFKSAIILSDDDEDLDNEEEDMKSSSYW